MGKNKPRHTRREVKKRAVEYKGGSCEICGYDKCLAALTFHHRNPIEKDFGISDIMNIIDWKKVRRELDKCHLLCSNCHIEVHNSLVDGYVERP